MALHDPIRDLMQSLAESIAAEDAFANQFNALAHNDDRQADLDLAQAFLGQARLHRVKSIEMRARLGALIAQYSEFHRDAPSP